MTTDKDWMMQRFKELEDGIVDVAEKLMKTKHRHDDGCPYKDSPEQCTCWIKAEYDKLKEIVQNEQRQIQVSGVGQKSKEILPF